ncbi:MAG: tetratricopeptide repeat protein, partial [Candidatus Competibacteraceae bacterium]|nr:tetratricopeptide repeat protein [Candidatus Competibacteraceae bacterium]
EEALAYYKAAALGSDDYRLAERAASIALFIKDDAALLEIARRWHELTPDQIQASQTLALALLRNAEVDEAVDLLVKQLLDKYDDQQQAYAVLGNLLNQLQDRQLILQVMTRILAHQPESRYALFNHALAALGADQMEMALEDLTNALKVAPDWRDAHLLRAQIRVQSDDIDAGLADLQTAVDAYPDDAELRMGYARLLISAERTDAARQQFELIAQANPDDAEALFALGVLAMEADQYDQAKQYYQRVLELGHRVQDVYFEMGRAEELQENYQGALDWYDRVIQGERYISAQVRAAAMAAKLGDLDEMALRLSELRRENPDNAVQLYISQAD